MGSSIAEPRSTRIRHHHKLPVSLWFGLAAAIGVVGLFLYYGHKQTAQRMSDPSGYLRSVPSDSQLRILLTPEQYHVTRENGTETAFHNEYWDNNRPGLYVDVITGEPLFSSTDKFDSHTGRPTFTKPISPERLEERSDTSYGMQRTEVRARRSNSHLGHVFQDSSVPTGLRYAINSAALRFVPLDKMEAEGYGKFMYLFPDSQSKPAPSPAK
jgi:peptide-methionine (R)-S-oxide reductase